MRRTAARRGKITWPPEAVQPGARRALATIPARPYSWVPLLGTALRQMQQIAVAIVNWNTRDLLRACLRSVLAEEPAEVVVADNGSQDGSVEMVRREFPSVEVIVSPENPGYGAASNRAISRCAAEYVVLLNSDTELRPGVSARAVAVPRDPPPGGRGRPPAAESRRHAPGVLFPLSAAARPAHEAAYRTLRSRHDPARCPGWWAPRWRSGGRPSTGSAGSTSRTTCTSRRWISATACGRRGGKPTSLPTRKSSTSSERARGQRRAEMLLRTRLSSLEFFRRHHRGIPLAVGLDGGARPDAGTPGPGRRPVLPGRVRRADGTS